jgi:hypothetical protein
VFYAFICGTLLFQEQTNVKTRLKKQMTIGASNKLRPDFFRAWQCAGSLVNTGEMRKQVDRDVEEAFSKETATTNFEYRIKAQKIYMEKSAAAAKKFGCGNCGEQSAIAFVFLREQKIFPIDWMEVDGYKHAFVIIGRAKVSNSLDFSTWGDEAVICDPWRNVVATVQSEREYFQTRQPNWIYGEAS